MEENLEFVGKVTLVTQDRIIGRVYLYADDGKVSRFVPGPTRTLVDVDGDDGSLYMNMPLLMKPGEDPPKDGWRIHAVYNPESHLLSWCPLGVTP